jgi:hypothetical protein
MRYLPEGDENNFLWKKLAFSFSMRLPNYFAREGYFKDICFAFWNTIEIRQVRPVEDIIKAVVEKS